MLRTHLSSTSRHERVTAAIKLLDSGVPEYLTWVDDALRLETDIGAKMILVHVRMRMACSRVHLEFMNASEDERTLFVIVECAYRRPERDVLERVLELKLVVGPLVRFAIVGYVLKLGRCELTSEAEIKQLMKDLQSLDLYSPSAVAPSPIFTDRKLLMSRCRYLLTKFRKQRLKEGAR